MPIFIPRDKQHLIELILSINDTASISIDSYMFVELGFVEDHSKGCLIGMIGEEHIKLYLVHSVIFRKDFYYLKNNERIAHRNNDLPSNLNYSYVDGTLVISKWYNHGINSRITKDIDHPVEIFVHSTIHVAYYYHTLPFKPSGKLCLMEYNMYKDKMCNVAYEFNKKKVSLEIIQSLFSRFIGIKKSEIYNLSDFLTVEDLLILEMYLM